MRAIVAMALVGLLASCQPTSPAIPSPSSAASASPSGSPVARTATPAPTLTGWGERQPLPTPRSEVAAVNFGGTILVIGGFGGPKVVERYIPISAAWKREPDLPIAVDHPMAAAVLGGDRFGIFVFGGYSEGVATNRAFYLFPAAQGSEWKEIAPMPAARAAGGAVTLGTKIYVVGGALDARTLHRSLYVYDVQKNVWSVGPDMPTPRDHLAA